MLSRAAESLYWMHRYIERAENTARIIDVNLNMMLDLPGPEAAQWEPLVQAGGDQALFTQRHGTDHSRENVIDFLTFDATYPSSILACLRAARENARSIREIISREMWESINRFHLMVNEAAKAGSAPESMQSFLAEVRNMGHQFAGAALTTMSHGEGWHFGRLGALLERADKTSRVLDVKYFYLLPRLSDVGTTLDDMQWTAVLRSVSGLSAFRWKHTRPSTVRVVEFLILDRDFPRAVHHCLAEAEESLRRISGTGPQSARNAPEHVLGRLRAELDFTRADDIMRRGPHEFIDDLQFRLNETGAAIHDAYFELKPFEAAAESAQ